MPEFHRTTITIEVLSPKSTDGLTVSDMLWECDEGAFVKAGCEISRESITPTEAAQSVVKAGWEPEELGLTKDGLPVETE